MRRRDFVRAIRGSAAAWPLMARAEISTKRPLIAVLTAITKESNAPLSAFVQGCRGLTHLVKRLDEVVNRIRFNGSLNRISLPNLVLAHRAAVKIVA
jgi:hypothetical protein